MKKIIFLLAILLLVSGEIVAQQSYGSTGLLKMPTAEMQKDKTFMMGGNFLHENTLPAAWKYDSYNYFLNFTLFPFLEISYTCTLFQTNYPEEKKYNNQDRFFSARLRLLEEKNYLPSVVVGANDFASTLTQKKMLTEAVGNGYFKRLYLALTKHFELGTEEVGTHLAYLYSDRKEDSLNGVAVGANWRPSFLKAFNLMAEYDSKTVNVGCSYLLLNRFNFFFDMNDLHYPIGGVCFIYTIR